MQLDLIQLQLVQEELVVVLVLLLNNRELKELVQYFQLSLQQVVVEVQVLQHQE